MATRLGFALLHALSEIAPPRSEIQKLEYPIRAENRFYDQTNTMDVPPLFHRN